MPPEPPGLSFSAHVRTVYARLEHPSSAISLLGGGFAFDAITLKRVDTLWENFWIVAHLAVAAACILLVNRAEYRVVDPKEASKVHFWLINAMQFVFFGGLLSTFLVFYFRSGSLRVSWPFFAILGAAFLANENLKHHYARLYFQISFFFLSLYCFTIFILPVVLHRIGSFIFLLSGAVSLGLLFLFLALLRIVSGENRAASTGRLVISIAAVFLTMNILYFLNLIPPLPLSLQGAGAYHGITRNADGNYSVEAEKPELGNFFRLAATFHAMPGASVYAYSAIFSP